MSQTGAPGGSTIADLSNQPGDASFVIDRVLAANTQPGWLHGLVDPARIGAAGHSLGAMTTYQLVDNQTCLDARIKAAVVMSGVNGGCGGNPPPSMHTPVLVTHGDHDGTLPYSAGKDSYEKLNRPKYFLTILGGLHTSDERGGNSPAQRAITDSMIAFFDEYLRADPGAAARLQRAATVPGVTTFVAEP